MPRLAKNDFPHKALVEAYGKAKSIKLLFPHVAYTFKGAIAAWDNPTDPVYEVGTDRSWTPDALSYEYTIDWHY